MARVAKAGSLEAEGIAIRALRFGGAVPAEAVGEHGDEAPRALEPLTPPASAAERAEVEPMEAGAPAAAAACQRELERQRALVQRVISQLAAERDRLLEQTRSQLLDIAMAVGKRIVRAELKVNQGVIERVLDEVLDSLRNCEVVRIRVHPSEARLAQAAIRAKDSVLGGLQQVELVRDAGISPGGCVVDTDVGTIDARLEAQLAALEEAVREEATGAD